MELASKMRDQLESALAEFNNSQKDKRKMVCEMMYCQDVST